MQLNCLAVKPDKSTHYLLILRWFINCWAILGTYIHKSKCLLKRPINCTIYELFTPFLFYQLDSPPINVSRLFPVLVFLIYCLKNRSFIRNRWFILLLVNLINLRNSSSFPYLPCSALQSLNGALCTSALKQQNMLC